MNPSYSLNKYLLMEQLIITIKKNIELHLYVFVQRMTYLMLQHVSAIMQSVLFQNYYSYVNEKYFVEQCRYNFTFLHTADVAIKSLFSTLSVCDPMSYVTNYWYDVTYS
jgi:hypothetical protein